MRPLLAAHYHKFLSGLAVILFAASGTWWWRQHGEIKRLRAGSVAVRPIGSPYETMDLNLPGSREVVWLEQTAQSHEQDASFGLFTPPVIHHGRANRSFTILPSADREDSGPPFDLELLGVRPELFRVQLAGYFGAPDDYVVAFIKPDQSEVLLAREGHRFESLGLTFRSFAVGKILVGHNEAGSVYDVAGQAVLADDRTGGEVVLDNRVRKFTDSPLAVVRPLNGGEVREVREGDTIADEFSTYHIESIRLEPPEAVVSRTRSDLAKPEIKVLHPAQAGGLAVMATQRESYATLPDGGLASSGR